MRNKGAFAVLAVASLSVATVSGGGGVARSAALLEKGLTAAEVDALGANDYTIAAT